MRHIRRNWLPYLFTLVGSLVIVLMVLLVARPTHASTTTLTGTIKDAFQNPVNGTLVMQLPVPAQDTTTNTLVSNIPIRCNVVNGSLSGCPAVFDVANLQPQNLYYITTVYDAAGQKVLAGNFVITGASFNLGSASPTNITTSNISFITPGNLNGNNVWTGLNTFTQPITDSIATGTAPFTISSTTVVPNLNIQVLNGVTVSGTPSAGQNLQATSASAATWVSSSGTTLKTECVNVTAVTVASSNTLTPLQACTIPANDIGLQTFYIDAFGSISDVGPPTITLCLYLDSTSLGCPTIPIKVVTGATWSYRGFVTGTTTGVSGTITGAQGTFSYSVPQTPNGGSNTSVCSTTNSAGATCTTVVTFDQPEPDTNYRIAAQCITPTQYPFIIGATKGLTSSTITISNGSAGQAQISTCGELDVVLTRPPAIVTAATAVPASTTVNTTLSHVLQLQVTWGTSSASNTITSSTMTIYRVG